MSGVARHTEWLSLVETSGPFLVPLVLEEAFPQGLEAVESSRRKLLRSAYDEWSEAVDDKDPDLEILHGEWIRIVLEEFLEYEKSVFRPFDGEDSSLIFKSPDVDASFAPDFVLRDGAKDKPFLLVSVHPPGTDLEKVNLGDRWPVSLVERMTLLCRHAGVQLGLLTNGERWMLVNAPVGSSSGHTSWYARLWFQEPITLQAFQSLLGVRRFFGPEEERLDILLEKSLEQQEEVTNTLGEQVRRAVEVLVQSLDRADQDRNRELLQGITPAELYEAGLTVMMRSVFVLCAEERGLLLLGDETYDQCYAISTLRSQLAEDADQYGPEVLERRHDAWSRLLAVFRAVHGGIEHEALRMPALGGSLFDPDRFPFLEGRTKGTSWKDTPARPLPIDNRTVLLLLSALQVLEQRGGALLLSYKALNVEQIGHVYEGLLEHTVERLPKTTLGLGGTKKVWNPNITLDKLEAANGRSDDELAELLNEGTGRSKSAIENALKKKADDSTFARVVAVCGGDSDLAERIKPYANLLRTDAWGDFIVYKADAYAVTVGADRRETGTHYTPKSLTEVIVDKTLEPVAFIGPAGGKPREEWQLKRPSELLDLKICDPAMGSGAFLVQVCRWLSERLVESWGVEEAEGKFVTVDGHVLSDLDGKEPMPSNLDDRLLIAKRLIAERCLYGVDINPLAVELAMMSIWLVTMAKGRPFGFLDHNLRCGDSLLGIHRLDQLTKLSMYPHEQDQLRLFGQNIEQAVAEVLETRKSIRAIPIRDIRDVETMASLDTQARKKLEAIEFVADAMIGEAFRANGKAGALHSALESLTVGADDFLNGGGKMGGTIIGEAREALSADQPEGKPPRKPMHWALEFPEVFVPENPGFDSVVGNPPFIRGTKIQTNISALYLRCLLTLTRNINGNADMCAHFYRKAFRLVRRGGTFGLLATNTIAQGDTRKGSLKVIADNGGAIYSANESIKWPGRAAVVVSVVQVYRGNWQGTALLNSKEVTSIDSYLTSNQNGGTKEPYHLCTHWSSYHNGSFLNGTGFVLNKDEANRLLADDRYEEVVRPYIGGKEVYSRRSPETPERYVIYFAKMPKTQAEKWPKALSIVYERVYPDRKSHKTKSLRDKWWIFKRPTPDLYEECRGKKRVIVKTQVSSTFAFCFLPSSYIFDQRLIVFPDQSFATFSVLQSSLHEAWAERYSATLKNDMSYTPKDCFETFPFPVDRNQVLEEVGDLYHSHRRGVMLKQEIGLTDVFRIVHEPRETSQDIKKLRELLIEMDKAVAAAYGWSDLELYHDFHETKHGIRFTISENARIEVLTRLLELNHSRYEEEVRERLHDKSKSR